MNNHQANETVTKNLLDESDADKSKETVLRGPPKSVLPLNLENSSSFDFSFGSSEDSSTQDEHVCSEAAVAAAYMPTPSMPANPVPLLPLAALQIRPSIVRPLVTPQESNFPLSNLVDNSSRVYCPFRLKCGVTVQVGENVLEACPKILEQLNVDLVCCLHVLPASVRWLVRRTKIWVNRTYSYGPVNNPKSVNHTTAHHFAGWLMCVRDNPQKQESIEIYNAAEYQKMRLHYNGCGLILHELCHIIHQKTLPGGLDNAMVVEIHNKAHESGKYTKVLRRDWALKEVDTDMAYCIVNHKEFFAEISVSYLADFYHDVDGAGTTDMAKCSPPFVAPSIVDRIRQKAMDDQPRQHNNECRQTIPNGKYRVIPRIDNMVLPHCNKFFPFTKGQLRRYDPRVYKCFVRLWQYIECWEDDKRSNCGRCGSFDWC
mmetsp:Transcript_20771/g.42566  ORF Transcript_20771/g.42566 Transcript_20771/m.42566 type:complete len:429 (-) Transcript_20771:112-1398(-)